MSSEGALGAASAHLGRGPSVTTFGLRYDLAAMRMARSVDMFLPVRLVARAWLRATAPFDAERS